MSSSETTTNERAVPEWLALRTGETLVWQGGPRLQTVYPGMLVSLVIAATFLHPQLPVIGALSAPIPTIIVYAWVRSTDYVVTRAGLYRKTGFFGRKVTVVRHETVENTSYSQGVTGTLFDWGRVKFTTAGSSGTELVFRRVNRPQEIQQIVDTQLSKSRVQQKEDELPGTLDQWQAVLSEVHAIRQQLERR